MLATPPRFLPVTNPTYCLLLCWHLLPQETHADLFQLPAGLLQRFLLDTCHQRCQSAPWAFRTGWKDNDAFSPLLSSARDGIAPLLMCRSKDLPHTYLRPYPIRYKVSAYVDPWTQGSSSLAVFGISLKGPVLPTYLRQLNSPHLDYSEQATYTSHQKQSVPIQGSIPNLTFNNGTFPAPTH